MRSKFSSTKLRLLVSFIGLLVLEACDFTAVYKDYVDIDNGVWHVDSVPTFDFTIVDASIEYQIDYNIRYTVEYPFRNLYITYTLEDSAGNVLKSDLQEINFFESKTGAPLGKGLGDIFDIEVLGITPLKVDKAGNYRIKLRQFMRKENLEAIMSVGIAVRPKE